MGIEHVLKGEPVQWNGLTLYPILMRDYPAFLTVKESLTLSQQTMAMPYCAMRYLDALYAMHYDQDSPLFHKLCFLLALSLRLDLEKPCLFIKVENGKLEGLEVWQGGLHALITSKNFGELRELIAQQNGLELPDETLNAELVEAQEDLKNKDSLPLKADFEGLLYAVALKARAEPSALLDWEVRRFRKTEDAVDRSIGHLISAITLAAGGKFKGGNPYPSWKYDREEQAKAIELLTVLTGRLSGSIEAK